MPEISIICPRCGSDFEIDSSDRSAFCPYCESTFSVSSSFVKTHTNGTAGIPTKKQQGMPKVQKQPVQKSMVSKVLGLPIISNPIGRFLTAVILLVLGMAMVHFLSFAIGLVMITLSFCLFIWVAASFNEELEKSRAFYEKKLQYEELQEIKKRTDKENAEIRQKRINELATPQEKELLEKLKKQLNQSAMNGMMATMDIYQPLKNKQSSAINAAVANHFAGPIAGGIVGGVTEQYNKEVEKYNLKARTASTIASRNAKSEITTAQALSKRIHDIEESILARG